MIGKAPLITLDCFFFSFDTMAKMSTYCALGALVERYLQGLGFNLLRNNFSLVLKRCRIHSSNEFPNNQKGMKGRFYLGFLLLTVIAFIPSKGRLPFQNLAS